MRKILFAMGIACLLTLIAPAQEVPRNEVFGGYSYVRTGTASQVNAFNNNGGLADLQYNFNEYISVIAELGGYHAGNISIRGPELSSVDQTYFSSMSNILCLHRIHSRKGNASGHNEETNGGPCTYLSRPI